MPASGRIGIIGAMPEEIDAIVRAMGEDVRSVEVAGRGFVHGTITGLDAVVVQSRVGKVAAATTATHLIATMGVDSVVFTGLAGGMAPGIAVGDLVVADRVSQHDLDASPIFPPMEVPLLGISEIPTDPSLTGRVLDAARSLAADRYAGLIDADALDELEIARPRVWSGLVVSGDRFVSSHAELDVLRSRVPQAVCVEMEGAAVGQVCYEHGVPFAIVRAISDTADDDAAPRFMRALGALASAASLGIIQRLASARA